MAREEKSAGAIIFYKENKELFFLLLKYPSYWGFPKGHIEPSRQESEEQAAKREIREETGLDIRSFVPGFKKTQRWYYTATEGDKKVIIKKNCVYFVAEIKREEANKIKISSEHEGFAFIPLKEMKNYIKIKQNMVLLRNVNRFIRKYGN